MRLFKIKETLTRMRVRDDSFELVVGALAALFAIMRRHGFRLGITTRELGRQLAGARLSAVRPVVSLLFAAQARPASAMWGASGTPAALAAGRTLSGSSSARLEYRRFRLCLWQAEAGFKPPVAEFEAEAV